MSLFTPLKAKRVLGPLQNEPLTFLAKDLFSDFGKAREGLWAALSDGKVALIVEREHSGAQVALIQDYPDFRGFASSAQASATRSLFEAAFSAGFLVLAYIFLRSYFLIAFTFVTSINPLAGLIVAAGACAFFGWGAYVIAQRVRSYFWWRRLGSAEVELRP